MNVLVSMYVQSVQYVCVSSLRVVQEKEYYYLLQYSIMMQYCTYSKYHTCQNIWLDDVILIPRIKYAPAAAGQSVEAFFTFLMS